jgi:hypothetical protein
MAQIYIDRSGKRFNPYATYTINNVVYQGNVLQYPEAVAYLGVQVVEEDTYSPPPAGYLEDSILWYRNEIQEAPFVIYTKKNDTQVEQILTARYMSALENHYDSVAQLRYYDDRKTCALRAGIVGSPFQLEGQKFGAWMDTCNLQAYQILAEVKAGTREQPSIQDFLNLLPEFSWNV